MVTIIRKGSLPGDRVHTGVCSNCKTQFTFRESEAKHYYGDQREPANELHIACPLNGCGKTVYVNLAKPTGSGYWDR